MFDTRLLLGLAFVLAGCAEAGPEPAEREFSYKGQRVGYHVAPCCDQLNTVTDAAGNYICAPDGGLTGRGDGLCTDFHETARPVPSPSQSR
jgi:hypothetical protein